MCCWESLPFFVRDEVFYLLPVNNIILLCKLGIIDCDQGIINFTGNHPFWLRYYQRNPYEYIKYQLECEGKNNDPDDILLNASKLGILLAVQEALKKGTNIYVQDDYAIRLAAENGHLKVVTYLIEYLVSQGANKINYTCD